MSVLHEWAITWGVPLAAVQDLQRRMGALDLPAPQEAEGKSEAWAQSAIRIEAGQKGVKLWRNNVGALIPKESKRPVRFGLANDSEAMNTAIKSADLVGWRPIVIRPEHVGHTLGQFVSVECKPPGWQYSATEHEVAQLSWAQAVNADGGFAVFATGPGVFP